MSNALAAAELTFLVAGLLIVGGLFLGVLIWGKLDRAVEGLDRVVARWRAGGVESVRREALLAVACCAGAAVLATALAGTPARGLVAILAASDLAMAAVAVTKALPVPRRRGEEGVAALELVIVTPLLIAVLGLAVIGGRIAKADGEVQGVVRAAARAASMQRSPAAAQSAADQAAQADLQAAGVTCRQYNLQLVTGPAGGVDRATLSCVVPLADVSWMGVGASKTITSSFSSPVDPYRESQ